MFEDYQTEMARSIYVLLKGTEILSPEKLDIEL